MQIIKKKIYEQALFIFRRNIDLNLRMKNSHPTVERFFVSSVGKTDTPQHPPKWKNEYKLTTPSVETSSNPRNAGMAGVVVVEVDMSSGIQSPLDGEFPWVELWISCLPPRTPRRGLPRLTLLPPAEIEPKHRLVYFKFFLFACEHQLWKSILIKFVDYLLDFRCSAPFNQLRVYTDQSRVILKLSKPGNNKGVIAQLAS